MPRYSPLSFTPSDSILLSSSRLSGAFSLVVPLFFLSFKLSLYDDLCVTVDAPVAPLRPSDDFYETSLMAA